MNTAAKVNVPACSGEMRVRAPHRSQKELLKPIRMKPHKRWDDEYDTWHNEQAI
jgi:hypothetical protein